MLSNDADREEASLYILRFAETLRESGNELGADGLADAVQTLFRAPPTTQPVAWRRVFEDGTYDVFHGKPREHGAWDDKRWTVEPLYAQNATPASREMWQEAIEQKPQPCACRFEWRPTPDFAGTPPKQLEECGFHAEQRRKLQSEKPAIPGGWHLGREKPWVSGWQWIDYWTHDGYPGCQRYTFGDPWDENAVACWRYRGSMPPLAAAPVPSVGEEKQR